MTIEEMIERLLSIKKPDARLKRFLAPIRIHKTEDGRYGSIRQGILPFFEYVEGEWWENLLAEWVRYADEQGLE